MTWRAFVMGLAAVGFICGLTYFNDAILRQNFLIGNFLPVVVYGGLLLFLICLNPLLARWRGWQLQPGEIALILAMSLAACAVPGTNLMRKLTPTLMMPHQLARTEAGWAERNVVGMVPPRMLADPHEGGSDSLDGFVQGMARPGESFSVLDIPWRAWVGTLSFWIPLILVLWAGLLGLALVVHRQWADHERLAHPIAQLVQAFLGGGTDAEGSLFRNRRFWLGAGMVLVLHLSNYLHAWRSGWFEIPLSFDFSAVIERFPLLLEASGQMPLLAQPTIYFSVMAIAFLLSREVSVSMGIGPYLYALVVAALISAGLAQGGSLPGLRTNFFALGASLGLFALIVFTGWHHYRQVFAYACRIGRLPPALLGHEVWGARIFIASQVAFVGMLAWVGVDWPVGVLLAVLFIVTFVVMSRVFAETGLYYMQPQWSPGPAIVLMLGLPVVGPELTTMLMLVVNVMHAGPRETLMPFLVTGIKSLSDQRVPLARSAWAIAGGVVGGMAIALIVTLFFQYSRGVNSVDLWAVQGVPKAPFQTGLFVQQALEARGVVEGEATPTGWARLLAAAPELRHMSILGLGLGMVVACSIARLRLSWWPIHPAMLLFWQTPHMAYFAFSFLLGGFLKHTISRYGGEAGYRSVRPLMLGVFAGEILAAFASSACGWLYYTMTGEAPATYTILPTL